MHKIKEEWHAEPESELGMIVNAVERETESKDKSSACCSVTIAAELVKTVIARQKIKSMAGNEQDLKS
jgi:hypothetical protein